MKLIKTPKIHEAIVGMVKDEQFKKDYIEHQLHKIHRGKVLTEELDLVKKGYIRLSRFKNTEEDDWIMYNLEVSYVRYVLRVTEEQLPWPEWKVE